MQAARDLAATLGLEASFAGFLNQTEMPKAYVAGDGLVLPSSADETWGLVCNEAMACGTPAIVSDRVGCAGDLVVDGQTGKVVPFRDPAAIGNTLVEWQRNAPLHESICRRARTHVEQHYSPEKATEGLKAGVAVARSPSMSSE